MKAFFAPLYGQLYGQSCGRSANPDTGDRSDERSCRYPYANVKDAMKASRSVEETWLKATQPTSAG